MESADIPGTGEPDILPPQLTNVRRPQAEKRHADEKQPHVGPRLHDFSDNALHLPHFPRLGRLAVFPGELAGGGQLVHGENGKEGGSELLGLRPPGESMQADQVCVHGVGRHPGIHAARHPAFEPFDWNRVQRPSLEGIVKQEQPLPMPLQRPVPGPPLPVYPGAGVGKELVQHAANRTARHHLVMKPALGVLQRGLEQRLILQCL